MVQYQGVQLYRSYNGAYLEEKRLFLQGTCHSINYVTQAQVILTSNAALVSQKMLHLKNFLSRKESEEEVFLAVTSTGDVEFQFGGRILFCLSCL